MPHKRQREEDSDDEDQVYDSKPIKIASTNDLTLRFLSAHYDKFEPLLPTDDKYISSRLLPHARETAYEEIAQPKSIRGKVKAYQLTGLSFLVYLYRNNANGILADEMGLGKTLQTLALLSWLRENEDMRGPHLIIAPLSVLQSWLNEIEQWAPQFKALRFHGGSSKERIRILKEMRSEKYDIVLCSYESFKAEHARVKAARRWQYLILDEGHKIKNWKTHIAGVLQNVNAKHRLLLTGTPLQNNLGELWSLLHFLYPPVFTVKSENLFLDSFDLASGTYDFEFMDACQRLLQLIMLRRTKDGVSAELTVPPREEYTLYAPLSPLQKFWYQRLLTKMDTSSFTALFGTDYVEDEDAQVIREIIERTVEETKVNKSSWNKLMGLLQQLRQLCNHPYSIEDGAPQPYHLGEHLVLASSKFQLLDKLLNKILKDGEKVLIFSGYTGTLDMVEDLLRLREIQYGRLDGRTSRPMRTLNMKLFNREPSAFNVFLISTRAGGLGVNCQAASNVIMMDHDWNPQVTKQAIARAHRIGQTKIVKVYTLLTEDSVETQMLTRIQKKEYLSAKVMGIKRNMVNTAVASLQNSMSSATTPAISIASTPSADDDDASDTLDEVEPDVAIGMTNNELFEILRGGAAALSALWSTGEDADTAYLRFSEAPIEEILQRSKHLQDLDAARVARDVAGTDVLDDETRETLEEEELRVIQGREAVQTRLWQGRLHATSKQSNEEIRLEWEKKDKRERKERTVHIGGHAISADTINNSKWTAVQTITADPARLKALQEKKRVKRSFEHQDYCITCADNGFVVTCCLCPRVCHATLACSGYTPKQIEKLPSFRCPQHRCIECDKSPYDAGGCLFRCQTCPRAYCEDCLPDDKEWEALGTTLDCFTKLGCDETTSAYFIRCHNCVAIFKDNAELRRMWKKELSQKSLC